MKGGLERAINAMFTCRPPPQFKQKGALITISRAGSVRVMAPAPGAERHSEASAAALHIDGNKRVGKLAAAGGARGAQAQLKEVLTWETRAENLSAVRFKG